MAVKPVAAFNPQLCRELDEVWPSWRAEVPGVPISIAVHYEGKRFGQRHVVVEVTSIFIEERERTVMKYLWHPGPPDNPYVSNGRLESTSAGVERIAVPVEHVTKKKIQVPA